MVYLEMWAFECDLKQDLALFRQILLVVCVAEGPLEHRFFDVQIVAIIGLSHANLSLYPVDWCYKIGVEKPERALFLLLMGNDLLCQVLEQLLVLVEDAEHVLSMIHRCDCIQVHIGLMRHSELLL